MHRGAFNRETDEWVQVITCDHMYSDSARCQGLLGESNAFVIRDMYSGLIHAYPVLSKKQLMSYSACSTSWASARCKTCTPTMPRRS